jgi:hypothetical protein
MFSASAIITAQVMSHDAIGRVRQITRGKQKPADGAGV